MRSHVRWVAIAAVVAGCRVEGGSPPGQAAGGTPPGGGFHFETRPDTTSPAERQVFDRKREQVAPGVIRLTLGAIVRGDQGQDAARAAMQAIVDEARGQDSGLAAIRVLAYFPPLPGAPHGTSLAPLGYVDWVPAGGWDSLSAEKVRQLHRYNFVFLSDIGGAPIPSTP